MFYEYSLVDRSLGEVVATPLDEPGYLCSKRTMYLWMSGRH
jgi:hypothetical protein